jgi:hypothetical protein
MVADNFLDVRDRGGVRRDSVDPLKIESHLELELQPAKIKTTSTGTVVCIYTHRLTVKMIMP